MTSATEASGARDTLAKLIPVLADASYQIRRLSVDVDFIHDRLTDDGQAVGCACNDNPQATLEDTQRMVEQIIAGLDTIKLSLAKHKHA